MASPELQRLWQLAQVDQAIESIKTRASHLDVGQRLAAEIKALETRLEAEGGAAKALRAEQSDLELEQKGIDEKIKKIDKQLYGGSIVNAREVENYEKEVAALKRQRGGHDERLLQLFELVPPAEKRAHEIQNAIDEKKKALAARRKQALEERSAIEAEYKRLTVLRPQQAEAVRNPPLVARYEVVRQRHQGIGMAEVTRQITCGACGTALPERTMEMLKDDKVATCQACTRILYYTEGLI
jgi:predicted  nucleic acid-binding Zn-ribbon protein